MFTFESNYKIGEENYEAAKRILSRADNGEVRLSAEQRLRLKKMIRKYYSERALL